MHLLQRFCLVLAAISLLAACSEEPKQEYKEPDWDRLTKAVKDEPTPAAAPTSAAASPTTASQPTAVAPIRSESQGGVTISLRPDQPSDEGCIRAMVKGKPGRPAFQWFVNRNIVSDNPGGKLCSDKFQRGDEVTVQVGTNDAGASTTVTIGNTPPRVIEVTATAQQAFEHGDITMSAVGADVDGDEVEFLYQWFINGEEESFLTQPTLPAASYAEGDQIQVRITPYDGFDEGKPYESAVLAIPNAPPVITSQPSQNFEAHNYSYQVEASDPDDAELTFSLTDPPNGMNISASGLINWPLAEIDPGNYKISIVVTDPDGDTATQEFTLALSKEMLTSE